ncbi:MAG: hypothetical protein E7130_06100 [Rikenellaceae bacterium]|nr:hypothetical protein [Rikenellaceae bacterium]
MINYSRNIVVILCMATITLLASCKGKEESKLSFPIEAAFVDDWGESTTLKFTYSNAVSVKISMTTGGWSADVDMSSRTLTITAPASASTSGASKTGSVSVAALSKSGDATTVYISTYIVDKTVDLSANGEQANCYIATEPNVKYRFNASVLGNTSEGIPTSKVAVMWMDERDLIEYLYLDNEGYANFFVDYAEDENGNKLTTAPKGNAIVAAYDAHNTILWSWHIWLVGDTDPRGDDRLSNHANIMSYNLGALTNPNGSTDHFTIWEGYGLYYQWGRKDPFPRPEYFDCAMNLDTTLFDAADNYVYISVKESNATTGTIDYAVKHPMTILSSSSSDSDGNWLYNNNRDDLWCNSGAKALYDPCPYGWRVPEKDTFKVLEIATAEDEMPLEQAEKMFGWYLTDKGNGNRYFFTGSGYRSYFDGIISNINYRNEYPYTPKPWVGYYWTAGTDSATGTASAMFFELNTSRATINAYKATTDQKRGNGMQIRCVKE